MFSHTYIEGSREWHELGAMYAMSIIFHVVISFMFLGVFGISPKRTYLPPVYTVELVSPPSAPSRPSREVTLKKDIPVVSKKAAKKRVAVKTPVVEKRPVKRKESEGPSKVIESSIEKIRENLSPEAKVARAIEALEAKIGRHADHKENILVGSSQGTTSDVALKLRIYYTEVWDKIRNNWALPDGMVRDRKDLQAIVIIRIGSDGKLIHIEFEKKSGDEFFDQSVMKAIRRSDPLPPLPKEYNMGNHEIGIRFNLSDLEVG